MALPEYTDGVFELYRIENDESEDYPEEKLRDTGMRFWYRELAVYDTTRAKLSADSFLVSSFRSFLRNLLSPGFFNHFRFYFLFGLL